MLAKNALKKLHMYSSLFGFNLLYLLYSLKKLPSYFRDYFEFVRIKKSSPPNYDCALEKFALGTFKPMLLDSVLAAGVAKGHYFHQDLLVARKIFNNNPIRHIDIGSRIDGFVSAISVFRKIEVMDIRTLGINIPNIFFLQFDAMGEIPTKYIECCDSLSSLHALEHFGLGRYGDPINYYGHIIGLTNFHKLLKPGGKLYLSVPFGKQRIEFNAHRVFSLNYLLSLIKDKFKIDTISYVDDDGDLHENIELSQSLIDNNYGCNYGCVILEMHKI